ncbi:MAG: hypothetical protein IJU76_04520 [Desulfovibrionaceae bacterium]|nr:hypothetical protein [Desulfovibrionaceae bacterium]
MLRAAASALSSAIHEYCHIFGADESRDLSAALTFAFNMLLENIDEVIETQKLWVAAFQKEEDKELE